MLSHTQVLGPCRSAAHVAHTLKSQLAEDSVRHAYGLPPRQRGLEQSSAVLGKWEVAAQELALRQARGIPVAREMYLAMLETGPRAKEVLRVSGGQGGGYCAG